MKHAELSSRVQAPDSCQSRCLDRPSGFAATRRWAVIAAAVSILTVRPSWAGQVRPVTLMLWSSCVPWSSLYLHNALASQGFERYVKRKRLDPLETYVPSVLLARRQLEEAGDVMGM